MSISNWIEAAGIPDSEALAAPVLSGMAGAACVSRSISDKRLSDDLLAAARQTIKMRLGLSLMLAELVKCGALN